MNLMWAVALLAAFSIGCGSGFKDAADLERKEQSPRHCADRCAQDDLVMAGYVYVGEDATACVCEPPRAPGGQQPVADRAALSGGVAAAQIVLQQSQQSQQSQQQTQTYSTSP